MPGMLPRLVKEVSMMKTLAYAGYKQSLDAFSFPCLCVPLREAKVKANLGPI
jgi:hypothetical protein